VVEEEEELRPTVESARRVQVLEELQVQRPDPIASEVRVLRAPPASSRLPTLNGEAVEVVVILMLRPMRSAVHRSMAAALEDAAAVTRSLAPLRQQPVGSVGLTPLVVAQQRARAVPRQRSAHLEPTATVLSVAVAVAVAVERSQRTPLVRMAELAGLAAEAAEAAELVAIHLRVELVASAATARPT
jgi:hypothetical protein